MSAPTLFALIASRMKALTAFVLVVATSGAAVAQERSEQKDITSEIEGDTQCIVSAKRWWFSWKQYNDAKDQALAAEDRFDGGPPCPCPTNRADVVSRRPGDCRRST